MDASCVERGGGDRPLRAPALDESDHRVGQRQHDDPGGGAVVHRDRSTHRHPLLLPPRRRQRCWHGPVEHHQRRTAMTGVAPDAPLGPTAVVQAREGAGPVGPCSWATQSCPGWPAPTARLVELCSVPGIRSSLDAAGCRRLITTGCRLGAHPPAHSALSVVTAHAGEPIRALVVAAGYNDMSTGSVGVAAAVDRITATARDQAIEHVVWLTYREAGDDAHLSQYRGHNDVLRAKSAADPTLHLADWAAVSRALPSDWFSADGLHLGADSARALAELIADTLDDVLGPTLPSHPVAGDSHLTVLLPARNAAHLLRDWLDDVASYADAVIALDDGSTDRTRDILEAHPLVTRVLTRPVRPSYHGWDDLGNRQRLVDAARDGGRPVAVVPRRRRADRPHRRQGAAPLPRDRCPTRLRLRVRGLPHGRRRPALRPALAVGVPTVLGRRRRHPARLTAPPFRAGAERHPAAAMAVHEHPHPALRAASPSPTARLASTSTARPTPTTSARTTTPGCSTTRSSPNGPSGRPRCPSCSGTEGRYADQQSDDDSERGAPAITAVVIAQDDDRRDRPFARAPSSAKRSTTSSRSSSCAAGRMARSSASATTYPTSALRPAPRPRPARRGAQRRVVDGQRRVRDVPRIARVADARLAAGPPRHP